MKLSRRLAGSRSNGYGVSAVAVRQAFRSRKLGWASFAQTAIRGFWRVCLGLTHFRETATMTEDAEILTFEDAPSLEDTLRAMLQRDVGVYHYELNRGRVPRFIKDYGARGAAEDRPIADWILRYGSLNTTADVAGAEPDEEDDDGAEDDEEFDEHDDAAPDGTRRPYLTTPKAIVNQTVKGMALQVVAADGNISRDQACRVALTG
ncbi:hypothetical protein DFJ74DRAFT_36300 [Hyaloraphidium curvatum]|nr:hypothetical protein DFJ74DRAFT_36300 [Hyaloraphidium curvatum]